MKLTDEKLKTMLLNQMAFILSYTTGSDILLRTETVLDLSGKPVTGTPSIFVILNFIIYRWNTYKTSISISNETDGVPVKVLIK